MQRPGLLTVNRDSRRNVKLLARRRSGTWPTCAEHCHIRCRSRRAFLEATTKLVSRTDTYSSDIQLHEKVFTRATAARSDGPYLSTYYRRCAGYQVSVCVLRFSCVGVPI